MIVNCLICSKHFNIRPCRVKRGHGKYCSIICFAISKKGKPTWNKGLKGFRKGENANEKNGMWKGNNVKHKALHSWVKRRLPKPTLCESCDISAPYDLANISQEYKRNLSDWEWLCRRCHMLKDGRLKIFLSHTNNGKQKMFPLQ